jgi:phage terminase small subunit
MKSAAKMGSPVSGLTPKQARFVAEYLIDLNGTQAAIRAGYSKKTAQEQSSRLLSNVMVSAAVEAGRTKITDRLEITAESLIRDVLEIGNEAREAASFTAALKSRDMLGNTLVDGNPFEGALTVKVEGSGEKPQTALQLAREIAFALSVAMRSAEATTSTPDTPTTH